MELLGSQIWIFLPSRIQNCWPYDIRGTRGPSKYESKVRQVPTSRSQEHLAQVDKKEASSCDQSTCRQGHLLNKAFYVYDTVVRNFKNHKIRNPIGIPELDKIPRGKDGSRVNALIIGNILSSGRFESRGKGTASKKSRSSLLGHSY